MKITFEEKSNQLNMSSPWVLQQMDIYLNLQRNIWACDLNYNNFFFFFAKGRANVE